MPAVIQCPSNRERFTALAMVWVIAFLMWAIWAYPSLLRLEQTCAAELRSSINRYLSDSIGRFPQPVSDSLAEEFAGKLHEDLSTQLGQWPMAGHCGLDPASLSVNMPNTQSQPHQGQIRDSFTVGSHVVGWKVSLDPPGFRYWASIAVLLLAGGMYALIRRFEVPLSELDWVAGMLAEAGMDRHEAAERCSNLDVDGPGRNWLEQLVFPEHSDPDGLLSLAESWTPEDAVRLETVQEAMTVAGFDGDARRKQAMYSALTCFRSGASEGWYVFMLTEQGGDHFHALDIAAHEPTLEIDLQQRQVTVHGWCDGAKWEEGVLAWLVLLAEKAKHDVGPVIIPKRDAKSSALATEYLSVYRRLSPRQGHLERKEIQLRDGMPGATASKGISELRAMLKNSVGDQYAYLIEEFMPKSEKRGPEGRADRIDLPPDQIFIR